MGIMFQEPLKAFRFLVEMDPVGQVAAFTGFSGIQMELDTLQVRPGNDIRGVQEYVPARTRFAPVTLTKGVVGEDSFLDWLFAVAAGPSTGQSIRKPCRNLNVVALDDKGRRGVTWTLYNALPIRYELTPMDGGRSEVLSESITFAITGVERKTGR